jgi:ParB family chromosome partitioning protein
MTSGTFTSFPIDKIWVDRATRQRRELNDIEELAESISKIGLINPPVIQHDGQLRAGERRWNAVKMLGWTHVSVQFVEDLDEAALHLLELEENLRRVDLTWQEECDAVNKYHSLRTNEDSKWTLDRTAEALGSTRQAIGEQIRVQKHIESGDSKIAKANSYSVARNVVRRKVERETTSVIAGIEKRPERHIPLIHDDFISWSQAYDGVKFNLLHCDFPYGINYTDSSRMNSDTVSIGNEYDDSPEVYIHLLDALARSMKNVVAESAHMIFWFSMHNYGSTRNLLFEMGWTVNPFPLIWHKSDNAGVLPDPSRGPRRTYETAFFCVRGDRKIVSAVANSFAGPTTKNIHITEKPVDMLHHFMRMVVDEYSVVLDPTCGSANAIKVAQRLGAAGTLGIEIDEDSFNLAKENFYDED